MKIIDLLNKIANEEEVPKNIKYDNYILTYNERAQDYYNYNEPTCIYSLLDDIHYKLNDKVEIIDDTPKEDKKIEKLNINTYDEILDTTLASKINEIIDRLNGEDV